MPGTSPRAVSVPLLTPVTVKLAGERRVDNLTSDHCHGDRDLFDFGGRDSARVVLQDDEVCVLALGEAPCAGREAAQGVASFAEDAQRGVQGESLVRRPGGTINKLADGGEGIEAFDGAVRAAREGDP